MQKEFRRQRSEASFLGRLPMQRRCGLAPTYPSGELLKKHPAVPTGRPPIVAARIDPLGEWMEMQEWGTR